MGPAKSDLSLTRKVRTENLTPHFVCTTCGAEYADSPQPPAECRICTDERQYVGWDGQTWTTNAELSASHQNIVKLEELGLYSIGIEPSFAIGQRAFLITHPAGNVLWDCIPLLDEKLVEMIERIGGLSAIAISHPHYYSSMVEWSRAFGGVPIYLHAADRHWVMRPDNSVVFWDGEIRELLEGVTLIRCGGHFDGGTVLHWASGAAGKGALLTGDNLQVVQDRRHVSFMYSYPNFIPLSAPAIQKIVKAVEPFPYERVYGAFWDLVIETDGKAAVQRSAERYLRAIGASSPGNSSAIAVHLGKPSLDSLRPKSE